MSDSWRIKKHSFIRLVLDFIKKLFGFFVFQRIKNKKDYNWKIRKNAALFEEKKKKRMDCRSHVGVTLPSSIVNKGRPAKMILIATRKATIWARRKTYAPPPRRWPSSCMPFQCSCLDYLWSRQVDLIRFNYIEWISI